MSKKKTFQDQENPEDFHPQARLSRQSILQSQHFRISNQVFPDFKPGFSGF